MENLYTLNVTILVRFSGEGRQTFWIYSGLASLNTTERFAKARGHTKETNLGNLVLQAERNSTAAV